MPECIVILRDKAMQIFVRKLADRKPINNLYLDEGNCGNIVTDCKGRGHVRQFGVK